MNLAGRLLKLFGWTVQITAPDFDKCIICVAPHTSNWDFVLGELAYTSVGRKAGFLMKESWFFFPLGYFFRKIGGIPVARKNKKQSLVQTVVDLFNASEKLTIAITPEGTRSRVVRWHTGFLQISAQANVPCLLGALDFANKRIIIDKVFTPTGDMEADMRKVKDYYKQFTGKYPEKFTTD